MLPSRKMGNMLGKCDCDCEETLEQKLAKQQRNLRARGVSTVENNGNSASNNPHLGGRRTRRSKTKKATKKNK